jgi:hypothetical protein
MPAKATRAELERRVEELEKAVVSSKQEEEKLRESEKRARRLQSVIIKTCS